MLSALVAKEEEEGGCDFVDGREPDPRRSWEDLPGVGGVTLFVMCGGRGGVPEPAAEREREKAGKSITWRHYVYFSKIIHVTHTYHCSVGLLSLYLCFLHLRSTAFQP